MLESIGEKTKNKMCHRLIESCNVRLKSDHGEKIRNKFCHCLIGSRNVRLESDNDVADYSG